jgi:hypothetical protein
MSGLAAALLETSGKGDVAMKCEHRGCNCKGATVERGGKKFCSPSCAEMEITGRHGKSCPCGHPGCAAA